MALFFTAFYERIFIIKRGMFKLVEVFCCCSLVSLAFFFLFFFFLFCLSFSCWEGSSDGNALTSRENLPGGVLSADKLPLQHFLDQLQRLNWGHFPGQLQPITEHDAVTDVSTQQAPPVGDLCSEAGWLRRWVAVPHSLTLSTWLFLPNPFSFPLFSLTYLSCTSVWRLPVYFCSVLSFLFTSVTSINLVRF